MDEKKLRLLKIKDLLLQKNSNEPLKLDGPEDIPSLETYRKNRKILSQGIETLKGIGPKLAQKLAKRDLHTIEDLLFFYPELMRTEERSPL